MVHEIEFTAASFFRIATLEARRGRNDPGQMFPSVAREVAALKAMHSDRRQACSQLWNTDKEKAREIYGRFRPKITALREEKRKALNDELLTLSATLSASIRDRQFDWGLQSGPTIRSRPTYQIRQDADSYFTMKQLELNLKRVFQLQAPNRNQVVAQLVDALEGKLPRYVLKTDISSYYESIPHDPLIALVNTRSGLSRTSTQLIAILLDEWATITGRRIGLPRGVGLSSYLAEAYARQIDDSLAGNPKVHFYGRYVDDMVLVARSEADRDSLRTDLCQKLSALGLELSAPKTRTISPIPLGGQSKKNSFDLDNPIEFLGYSISKQAGDGGIAVDISTGTIDRYIRRLRLSFDRWANTVGRSEGHNGLLLDRVKFLTSNTKLANSKDRAVTGIYFNHAALTIDAPGLVELDAELRTLIDQHAPTMPQALHIRLLRNSFIQGFTTRRFYNYSQAELVRIVAVWRGI